jgi:DNA-binding transcriptional MerR regulator
MAERAGTLARRAAKSPAAFRTISEVADDLEVPQHVLRFWESKFPQVKPLKRGGGRRYYRPEDVTLLRRIRQCLYQEGYTIKGVQRLLREGSLKIAAAAAGSKPLSLTAANDLLPAQLPEAPEIKLDPETRSFLEEIRDELVEWRAALRRAMR